MAELRYEAIIIGTGFGGAIAAARLSKQWPEGQVLILERGKRWPKGSFQRSPRDTIKNLWNVSDEARTPAGSSRFPENQDSRGVFDMRTYQHMDVLLGSGYGGGSLIYSNVFMIPPDEIFDERWPNSCRKNELMPYFQTAREVLGARTVPQSDDPRRQINRTGWFGQVAEEMGRKSELVEINVFFGNDFDNPLEMGLQQPNRYGAIQTSCIYCAECNIGCNIHAKNTLDLNYLFVAENRYGARVLTEHRAEAIVPLDENGDDDPQGDGRHGYRVYYQNLADKGDRSRLETLLSATTRRVIVSAGCLGSNELLLRSRDVYRTLPSLNDQLGRSFSGNGDFLGFCINSNSEVNPNYGPVITQRVDFNLFENFDRDRAFILEDGGYPPLLAWVVEGFKPRTSYLKSLRRLISAFIDRLRSGQIYGSAAYQVADLLGGELSSNSTWLQFMGVDRSDGRVSLNRHGEIDVDWPYRNNMSLYEEITNTIEKVGRLKGADLAIPMPAWNKPWRRNLSVHLLGGCVVGDSPDKGLTSADPNTFGQVYGYQGLFVCDGAIVPTAVGANPSATIAAMAEMVAHGITNGPQPTADL